MNEHSEEIKILIERFNNLKSNLEENVNKNDFLNSRRPKLITELDLILKQLEE